MTTTTNALATSTDYFESIYADAEGDASRIPWEDGHASDALINWLNTEAPSIIRCGARVAVAGCGLGDDARALIHRGYEVTAFDCSGTAVHWAQSLDPSNATQYLCADLLDPPGRWRHRFDLAVEVNNLQSLTSDLRPQAVAALADLLTPHGRLLVICRGATTPADFDAGPPWPLTEAELLDATTLAGLVQDSPLSAFYDDDDDPSVLQFRAVFRRA